MEKNTKENRKKGISSNEEYEEALKRLKYYKDEYKWLSSATSLKEKIREVNEEALKIIPMLNTDSTREQLYYRKYYNSLIRKKYLIESGRYQTFLRNNMLSVFATIMQYKIDSKNYTFISIAKGFIGRDETLLEDMQKDRILSRVKIWEGIPAEEDLAIQSPQEILEYIDKHCNLVGIQIPETSEGRTLLPAISEGYLSKEQKLLIEMLDRFINDEELEASKVGEREDGLTAEQKEEMNLDKVENHIVNNREERFKVDTPKQASKEKLQKSEGEIDK